jgi:hypothetical protein
MNTLFSLYERAGPRLPGPAWFAKGLTALWRAADLGPILTFATGIIVGLLIPSSDWPAIVTVIATGALLHRMVSDR